MHPLLGFFTFVGSAAFVVLTLSWVTVLPTIGLLWSIGWLK